VGMRRSLVAEQRVYAGEGQDRRRRPVGVEGLPGEEFAWGDEAEDAATLWTADAECDDESLYDLLAGLREPEASDWIDFTDVIPAVRRRVDVAPRPAERAAVPARRASGRRIAQVSVRLAEIGAIRPVVRIPGRAARARSAKHGRRTTKLPPVWLIANLVIVLAAGIAVLPRLASADAAAACLWHTVVPGDTLGNLGWEHHTTALALARANHIANPNLILVGERLCIPLAAGAQASGSPSAPSTSHPPNYGTARGVRSFVEFVLPYARQAHAATGWPTSLILAQWGIEQGWRLPTYTGYNFGNCGAVPGEPTIGGLNVPGSPAAFAYARTPEDGLRFYVHVAHLGYYTGVTWAAAHEGVDAAARALGRSPWDAGHYTAIGVPGSSLLSVLRVYNLYWYDTH
jgi:LysM repeat protein